MTARQATQALQHQIFQRCAVSLNYEDANTLRRAQLTLQRWAELECGNSNDYGSWAIERDDNGEGPPFMVCCLHSSNEVRRTRIPDREAGALRRVKEICERNGLHFYHQTDPRGCALYVSDKPMPDFDYTRGVACCE